MRIRHWIVPLVFLILCAALELSFASTGSLYSCEAPLIPSHQESSSVDREFQSVYQCMSALNAHNVTITTETVNSITASTLTFSDGTKMTTAASSSIILQSTGCTNTATKSVSTSTFSQTNCSCTITPTSASSRIFISATGELDNAASGITGLTIMRGATNNITGTSGLAQYAGSGLAGAQILASMSVVDNNYLSTNTTTYYVGLENSLGDTPNFGGATSRTQQMIIMEFKNP